ncbi:MAG: TIGR03000 domain-containing protein, partial [Gemmataceae bacterium]|nr:TIGR03000 domain-containing protein [Gemmataceae bacterium]
MYSVVMMMALTGGAEAPDFGRRGCSGCNGCYSSCHSSCYSSHGCSGCYSSCHGGRGGLFRRKHGCNSCSGCHVSYSCSGFSCSGCSGFSCSGFGCSGGWGCSGFGCAGGIGCAGGVVVTPVAPATGGKEGGKEGGKDPGKAQLQAPATIVVSVPADATVTIDGNNTNSTSAVRRFVSPTLPTGREFHYTLTAEVIRNGNPVRETQRIAVRAGEETPVR